MTKIDKYLPMIENYMQGEAVLTFISENIIDLIYVLDYLGDCKDTFIDSAVPMLIQPKTEVMLTTTSIAMLYRYNILKDLGKFYTPYVLRSTMLDIRNELHLLKSSLRNEELKSKYLLENENLNKEKLELLQEKVEKLEEIKIIIESFNVIDIYKELEDNIISVIIPKSDVEAAEYARDNDIHILVDDAGTMGLFETFIGNKKISNTSGIINVLINIYGGYKDYSEAFKNMIKDKYLFATDFKSLCSIIGICISENRREDLKEIIMLLLKNDYEGQYKRLLEAYVEISPNSKYTEKQIVGSVIKEYKSIM